MHRLVRRDWWRMVMAVVLLSALGSARPALAGHRSSKAKAKAYFLKGLKEFRVQNFPDALAFFQKSFKLYPKPVSLYNIGMCYRALFNYTKAIDAFEKYLKMLDDMESKLSPAKKRRFRRKYQGKRKEVTQSIQEMNAKLARVVLAVQPAGARVMLDGEFVGTAPGGESLTLKASPGAHVLEITKSGYRSYRKEVTLVAAQQTALSVILSPLGAAKGTLIVESPVQGARAIVDGGAPMPLPMTLQIPAGAHNVTVTAPGHQPKAMVLSVQAGAVVRQVVQLAPVGAVARPARPQVAEGHPEARVEARPVTRPAASTQPRPLAVQPRPRETQKPRAVPAAALQPTDHGQATPWYKTWWFWTSIGAAVLTGVVVGAYMGKRAADEQTTGPAADTTITLK